MERKINKLLLKDCITILSILIVLWLILCFVMIQVGSIAPNHSIRTGIIIAGILAGTFSTASTVAVFIHLRANRKEIYSLELSCENGINLNMDKKKLVFEIFDSIFIMVLCFATLFTAMLLKGGSINLSYTIHIKTFLAVILGLTACMAFILNHSEKGLKKIIEHLY